ncbi:DinB family protein [Zeaxanthinibacter enoshimensis]|uniref:DinB family protein n=1 Tax=Zeaxanthinibacter enoshimensis TaxID=392009 RepID=UPI0035681C4F
MKILLSIILIISFQHLNGQEITRVHMTYEKLPDRGSEYTAGSVLARMIDGLGFRYYWATEGLGNKEYEYRAGEELRSIQELMRHIYDLSEVIIATARKEVVDRSGKTALGISPPEMRSITLERLRESADLLAGIDNFSDYPLRFQGKNSSSEFSFLHLINGPVSDAIWHTGQIVMLRRAAGNPIPPGVNVFLGTSSN